MSVRKGDRGEGKLQVLNKARELKEYSLNQLKNEKHFPKSTRWLYSSPIATEVREACICIRHANSVYVTNGEEYKYRRMEQVKAHAHLDALLDLIDDAYRASYISGDKVEFWTGLILKTDDLLKAWIKSDKDKYKNM
jgi:hypothetical protein